MTYPPFSQERFSPLLRTHFLGRVTRVLAQADSSNQRLIELAAGGEDEGSLILAEEQSAGRGRWGRSWEGQAGKSLLFSFLLRPGRGEVSQLSAVFGLALLKACGMGQLKWPNDLWIAGRKAGGMLLEGSAQALVVGIGLNVNQEAADFPDELRALATSLKMEDGKERSREALLAEIALSCEEGYLAWKAEGFSGFKKSWDENACFMGQRVRAGNLEGVLSGLNDDGSLSLRTATGVEKLVSGEVFGLRPVLD